MKKYIICAILRFIDILLLTAGIVLGWVGYVYDGMPLISAICFTITNAIFLLFHATEYVIEVTYFKERNDEKDQTV